MYKRFYILSLWLLFALCMPILATTYPTTSYTLSDDGTTLVKWTGSEANIDLASDPAFSQVTTIGTEAFSDCATLKTITFPAGLKTIGTEAFRNSGLTSVTLPQTVTSLGEACFFGCSSLKSLQLPPVRTIPLKAFDFCSGLTQVVIPDGVFVIGDHAFANCSAMTSLTLPESLTEIGPHAFAYCSSLTAVVLPHDLTTLAHDAFRQDSKLASVVFNGAPSIIGAYAFRSCFALTHVELPTGVSTVGEEAFAYCTALASVFLPSTTISLESGAFLECRALTSVTCNAFSRPALGTNVFKNVPQSSATLYVKPRRIYGYQNDEIDNDITEWGYFGTITSLTWPKSYELSENGRTLIYWYGSETNIDMTANPELADVRVIADNAFYSADIQNIVLPTKLRSIGYRAFGYCDGLKSITLPESLEKVGNNVFFGCSSMTRAVFLNPSTTMGTNCFAWCSSLSDVQLPANLTALPDRTFAGSSSLTSYTLPPKVTTVGKEAFLQNYKLTSVVLPNYVTHIDDQAFYSCNKLTSVTCLAVVPPTVGTEVFRGTPQSSATLHVRRRCSGAYNDGDDSEPSEWKNFGNFVADATDDTRYMLSNDGKTLVYWLSEETQIDMTAEPELAAVTTIGNRAFNNMMYITQLVLPKGLTKIEERGLSWCEQLSAINIPESVTSIGVNAFMGCYALISINLPSKLTTISDGMFSSCRALENVWVQDKVTSIGKNAFRNCQALKSIILPNTVRTINEGAFAQCKSLSIVQIPDQVSSIGQDIFNGCISLTSFSLPTSVKTLPRGVFEDCSKLAHVDLPPSLTSIGNRVFENCDSLRYIEIPRTVKTIDDYAFSSCDSLKHVVFQGIHSQDLPPMLTTIGEYVFNNCKGLESIELPSTVTSIGRLAFRWCSNLRSFACHRTTPPTLGDEVFLRLPQAEATLYVPESSISSYANADQWKEFATRKALVVEWEKTETLTADDVVDKICNNMVMVKGDYRQSMPPFKMSKYEVTQDIWQAVMNATPSSTKDNNLPVDKVSWDDCQTFLEALNALSELTFRLPTEAEWNYAAEGGVIGQPTTFAGSDDIDAVAWYAGNAAGLIHLPGSKLANETGLYDMTGNVEEWTQTEESSRYVAKGGYYSTSESNAALTARNTYTPSTRRAGLGLRLVLDAPAVVTDPKVLVITTHDGLETTYYLRKYPKVTMDDDELVVKASNATVRFPLTQIKKLSYKITDPIPTQVDINAPWRMTNEAVVFNDLPENATVNVYTIDGKRVGSYQATSGSYALSLNTFSPGIYIINVNGLTFKIYKR